MRLYEIIFFNAKMARQVISKQDIVIVRQWILKSIDESKTEKAKNEGETSFE